MREMVMAEMGQYAHGNQPIQHMIYLYNYAGQPWKSQYWARQVMHRLYNSTEDGYPGDEDQGQTSSWYVLSALGLYSVCPGTDEYVLGSPVFKSATIALENGNTFTINAPNNDLTRPYIKSATLNGQPLTRNFLRHAEITAGGELTLEMSAKPNKARGTAPADRPFSVSK
jgi:predicted alpha-1,2-mannosidase